MYEPRGPIRRPNYELSEPKPFQTRLDKAPELKTPEATYDRLLQEQERVLGGCEIVGSFAADHNGGTLLLARRETKITTVIRNEAVDIPECPAVPVEGAYDFIDVPQQETFLMHYDGEATENRLAVYNVGPDSELTPNPVYGPDSSEAFASGARTQPQFELIFGDDEACTGATLTRENGTKIAFSHYDRESAAPEVPAAFAEMRLPQYIPFQFGRSAVAVAGVEIDRRVA